MWFNGQKRALVIGHYASFAGAGELARELARRAGWQATLVVDRKDEFQNFWSEYGAVFWPDLSMRQRRRLQRLLHRADLTLIAGACSLDLWTRIAAGSADPRTSYRSDALAKVVPAYEGFPLEHRTAILVSDSHVLLENGFWNELLQRLRGMHVFAMPDLIPWLGSVDVRAFWPPVDCARFRSPRRSEQLVLGHSPSKASRRRQKGSDRIEAVCEKHGIPLELLTEMSHVECLERKADLPLFVDQISEPLFEGLGWHGGLGKSGLEALALGAAVVTSGMVSDADPDIPLPPVVWTDRDRFESDLLSLWNDPDRIRVVGKRSQAWADRYATPRAMMDHLLRHTGLPTEDAKQP